MYINKHKWTEALVFWDQDFKIKPEIDVYYLLHEFDKSRGQNISEHINFKTELISDTPEEMFSSSVRRKWRKLGEDIEYKFLSNLSEKQIDNIVKEYNLFAEQMHLTKMEGSLYKQMNDEGKLFATIASKDGKFEYIHTFYVSKGIARLFHTFPASTNTNRDINIGLHRFDLISFKENKVSTYDWGGAGLINEASEKKLAIREYKRRFGGIEFTYYKARIAGNKNGEKVINEEYKY